MTKCFLELTGRAVEAYVDGIRIMSKKTDDLVSNLAQTFAKIQENGIKLNPKKCDFGDREWDAS